MDGVIEAQLDSPDGIVDCRIELQSVDGRLVYNITLLYPNVVDGYSRSEIYCYDMVADQETGKYRCDCLEDRLPPKIKKLESKIQEIISESNFK